MLWWTVGAKQSFADPRLPVLVVYCHLGATSKISGTTGTVGYAHYICACVLFPS